MTTRPSLSECVAPDLVPAALRKHAEDYYADAAELEACWQDKQAGAPWIMIARELERAADRIERKQA